MCRRVEKQKICFEWQRTPADLPVSWLKFEPKVSNFPVTKTAIAVLVTCAIMTIFLFFYLFFEGGTALAASRKRISWLKFEPKVSNFPVFVFLFISTSVCEGCPVYVAGVAPVSGCVWKNNVCLA